MDEYDRELAIHRRAEAAALEERRNRPTFEDSVTPTQPIDANNEGAPPAQAALNDDGDADL